ncbi:MAG: hypothetical protein IPN71_10820 [Fibrobacteres bacterium]|nr:hypothetical protein [Fibrobacterota bacterium]
MLSPLAWVAALLLAPAADADSLTHSVKNPPWLPLVVQHRTLADLADSSGTASRNRTGPSADDSSKLAIQGSKTIQVGIGGDGGVALEQSLFLTAKGPLRPGVDLDARISDGNLPLSAQGASASLREVDEIWIDVSSLHWATRLGDQDWNLTPGLAGGFQRRLRGWSVLWKHDADRIQGIVGGPAARWVRSAIDGVDGQQEGYALVRNATDARGAVVPGSERVRLNGQLLTSGGDADYLVRYLEGRLDFSPRRRIHAGDRIEVEFQAADLDYERTFAGARTEGSRGGLRWEAWALQEGDQPDHALSYASDSITNRILREAGSDSLRARDSSGNPIPMARQVGEAGVRGAWGDSSLWIRTDFRGSTLNRNLSSDADPTREGIFLAFATGSRAGRFLDRSGAGLWTATVKADHLQQDYHGISSPDTLGSGSSDWIQGEPGMASSQERSTGTGSLSWQVLRGIGVWSLAGAQARSDAFLSRAQVRTGIDLDSDRQLLAEAAWSRRDQGGLPWEATRTLGRASWPLGAWIPRLEAKSELATPKDTGMGSRWVKLSGEGGTRWSPGDDWTLDLSSRLGSEAVADRRDLRGQFDTARWNGAAAQAKWTPSLGSLELSADWETRSRRSAERFPWTESDNWLGEATAAAWPLDGLRATGHWRLSSTAFQPEVPAYDTVPKGTGAYAWDTLLRTVVLSDEGDLRYAGTRLDTSIKAVRANRKSLSADLEVVPVKIRPTLTGLVADLGGRLHGKWDQTDSVAGLFPDFDDASLETCPQASSELGSDLWWTHSSHRLDLGWNRRFAVGTYTAGSVERELVETMDWSTTLERGHRLLLGAQRGNLIQREPSYRREELRWRLDPSFGLRVAKAWEIRPGWLGQWGEGRQDKDDFRTFLNSPYLVATANLPKGLKLRAEGRRADARMDGPSGTRLTDGFPPGRTWRAQAGIDWAWKDKVQANLDWTLRDEPDRPLFQKLSAQARANF